MNHERISVQKNMGAKKPRFCRVRHPLVDGVLSTSRKYSAAGRIKEVIDTQITEFSINGRWKNATKKLEHHQFANRIFSGNTYDCAIVR